MDTTRFNPSAFHSDLKLIQNIQRKFADLFRPQEELLDLGCGNGIFLELLKERSVRGVGVDSFSDCVESCRQRGLEVHQAELLPYVEKTDEQFNGIFCSHIVEHLSPETVLKLFAHAHRVLRPGGRIIIVTPNPKDIEVITERFWLDITHVRPYPLPLLEKMLEHSGFSIEDSGRDRDSAIPVRSKNPRLMLQKAIKKLRWGEYWGNGDTYVVARRTPSQVVRAGKE
jgi:SAM-dependent methyltransferase